MNIQIERKERASRRRIGEKELKEDREREERESVCGNNRKEQS